MLKCDEQLQLKSIAELKKAIDLCEQHQDYISRDILENLLEREESHLS